MDFSAQRTRERFAQFSATLASQGLRPALADLLGETDYRFIALFCLNGEQANAAVFYDRTQPETLLTTDVPVAATYCAYTRDARQPFMTANSLTDPRLAGHVARESVQAYCGVPILTPEGEFLATLCHYDLVPRDPAQIDLALMCEIASALQQGGHVPARPVAPTLAEQRPSA